MEKINLYTQFDKFPDTFISKYFKDVAEVTLNKEIFEKSVLDYFRPTLIYLINEKRVQGELIGDTPEERYSYFNEFLCEKGVVLSEIESRFPEILRRVQCCIEKYLNLQKKVKESFIEDFSELQKRGFLKNSDVSPIMEKVLIKVTGDIHNGGGVCIVEYCGECVVFKRKSALPNLFLQEIDELASRYFGKNINFIPSFLDYGDYFWEKYIPSEPLESKQEAREFYENMGYLLFYAYIFNISDLHFENIISSKMSPKLVDVETMFSLSPMETIGEDLATKKLTQFSRNSVIATGILPISEANRVFGGDMSGILGGVLVNEVKVVINKNRDDICIKKQKQKTIYRLHLPYYNSNNGEKCYIDAKEYIQDILTGFRRMSTFFIQNKSALKKVLQKYSKLKSRILFRNTRDYGLINQLLLSPIYSKKEDILLKKMSDKFSLYDSKRLCESESKQLLNMDIPIFYSYIDTTEVCDQDNCIWNLKQSALKVVLTKIKQLNEKIVEIQVDLIIFSLTSTEQAYSTELQDDYRSYTSYPKNKKIIYQGINYLVDRIVQEECHVKEDGSSNWLTLKVTDFDNLELVPMDLSLYDGLAGLALSLCECYPLLKGRRKEKVFECLKRLFVTISKGYFSVSDASYYAGRLGILSVLNKVSKITYQQVSVDIKNDLLEIIDDNVLNNTTDFLSGFPSMVVLLKDYLTDDFLNKVLEKLLSSKIDKEVYVQWCDDNINNVSLAHGNIGIELTLLLLAGKLNSVTALELFKRAKRFDDIQKLSEGWKDNRNHDTSANWCHGSTGVLVARLKQLEIDNTYHILSKDDLNELLSDVEHAVCQIVRIGFDMTNFTLCHGTSGNLLALSYFNSIKLNNDKFNLDSTLKNEYCKMNSFGLERGWMCSFNTKYNSVGLMTGVAGIIYSSAKYLKNDSSLEVLIPTL